MNTYQIIIPLENNGEACMHFLSIPLFKIVTVSISFLLRQTTNGIIYDIATLPHHIPAPRVDADYPIPVTSSTNPTVENITMLKISSSGIVSLGYGYADIGSFGQVTFSYGTN